MVREAVGPSRRANDSVEYGPLREETRAAIAESEVGVLEGAGGLRVPLSNDPRREIVDLVADLGTPALVVTRSGLGTLNHAALTVEALRRRDVPVLGVALNRCGGASVAERTNPDELERMCDCTGTRCRRHRSPRWTHTRSWRPNSRSTNRWGKNPLCDTTEPERLRPEVGPRAT